MPSFDLVGYATVSGVTVGGHGGATVHVDNIEDLIKYTAQPQPLIVYLSGQFSGNLQIHVSSNKTIFGEGQDTRLTGIGFAIGTTTPLGSVHNIVIRNIYFEKQRDPIDAIEITNGAHHVWIDHCSFSSDLLHGVDYYDGLIDITRAAQFITVSWNIFKNHFKVSLVGNDGASGAEDVDHLTVTYHHNLFKQTGSRNPSVRFGNVHIFNNYYKNIIKYAIASRDGASILLENNFFQETKTPLSTWVIEGDTPGTFNGVSSNLFRGSSFEIDRIVSSTTYLRPPYMYRLDAVEDIPKIVEQFAGPGIISNLVLP